MPKDAYIGSQELRRLPPRRVRRPFRVRSARTLRPAARTPQAFRLNGATFPDPERPAARLSYSLHDGQFWMERREGEQVERFLIDYAFGSGRHATTFVT